MSKKHVEDYYNQITADYTEMIENLKEMEELAAQKVVNPDKIDELRAAVEPLKNNYMTISWIMFLLNQPNKKEKIARYKNVEEKKVLTIDPNRTKDLDGLHKENKKVIETINTTWTTENIENKD